MKKEKALICLEKMGIGGVETAVLNQVAAYIKQGIECVVVAKEGIYSSKVEELGAKFIDFEFKLKNSVDGQVVKDLVKIIKDENITQVHINQFPCMQYVVYACFLTQVAYVAYIHTGYDLISKEDDMNIYNWYCKHYPIYNELFNIYFNNAKKIVAITPFAKEYAAKKFNIDENKIQVCPNSVDFSLFTQDKNYTHDKKVFLIIGRLSKEKEESLFKSLDFYKKLKDLDDSFVLQIAGDGNARENIEKYIEDNNIQDVTLLGQINNVPEVMNKSFIAAGVGRCIIDSIASSTIPLIISTDGVKDIVTKDNIMKCIEGNFSTNAIDSRNIDELLEEILNIDEKREEEITKENYKLAKEMLDINNNIVILDSTDVQYSDKLIIDSLLNINHFIAVKSDEEHAYIEHLEKDNSIIEEYSKQIDELNYKLQGIYCSRTYKLSSKLSKVFNKNRKGE